MYTVLEFSESLKIIYMYKKTFGPYTEVAFVEGCYTNR